MNAALKLQFLITVNFPKIAIQIRIVLEATKSHSIQTTFIQLRYLHYYINIQSKQVS